MPSASALDAVTVDAAGTLLELADPIEPLRRSLEEAGVRLERAAVADAFAAEVAWYVPRSHEGSNEAALATLRREAVGVFLAAAGADLEPEGFVPIFLGAIEFRPLAGAEDALHVLRGAGLALACVANWDVGLHEHLARAGLTRHFAAVVSSAEVDEPKPRPEIFRRALGRVGVAPGRALHVGDDDVDRDGAHAAGLFFEPAPLATLPERLGLRKGAA